MARWPMPRGDLIERVQAINGSGTCGMDRPLRVASLANGAISIGPTATLGCPLTAAAERWLAASVQPAALARFGSPVVRIKQLSSYSCRRMNNGTGTSKLSEHAFGNALDVAVFYLADGREVSVKSGWRGAQSERDFLREVFLAACEQFNTVLGPGSDRFHEDHFHLDLARHGQSGTTRYCRPRDVQPPPPPGIPENFFGVAAAGASAGTAVMGYAPEVPGDRPADLGAVLGEAAPAEPELGDDLLFMDE